MISDDNYQVQSHRHFCTQDQLSFFFSLDGKMPFCTDMFLMMERGLEITHLASVKIRIGQE